MLKSVNNKASTIKKDLIESYDIQRRMSNLEDTLTKGFDDTIDQSLELYNTSKSFTEIEPTIRSVDTLGNTSQDINTNEKLINNQIHLYCRFLRRE